MTKTEFDPTTHTKEFFEQLSITHNKNKTHMAKAIGTTRSSLNRWIIKANVLLLPNIIDNREPIMEIPFTGLPHFTPSKQYLITLDKFKKVLKDNPDSEGYKFFFERGKGKYAKLNDPAKRWDSQLRTIFEFINEYLEEFER